MSAVLDYAAGSLLSGPLGGNGAAGTGSIHSGPTHRSRRSGSRATSPSALSAKSGSTNCSTGRLSASEIKRVLDKLKAELDNERMKNRQFVKERASELKKSKLWFEREKQAALESMAHDLKRDREKSLRENDNEWRQAVKARDEEIRLLREDLKTANTAKRDDAQSLSGNNEEFVLRLQKEIRILRQTNRDLDTKWKAAARSAVLNDKQSDSSNSKALDTKLLRNVQDLVHDLDAQVNSEAFYTSGTVPELPDTLRQLKEQLRRLAAIPEQLSPVEKDRIRQMERALHRLRSENEDLKKQRQSDEASSVSSMATSTSDQAEEKIKKLKRRNAELVAIARRLEERLKSSQQQRRQAKSDGDASTSAESTSELRQEFERQRSRDLADHAKAMLERDKQLENLRRRLETSNTSSNAATYEAMEVMLKTAQRERLQLEKQLTWYTHKDSSGGEGGLDPDSGPSTGNTSGGGGGNEQLPILQEKLKIIAERLKTRDQENQALGRQLENALKRIENLEETEHSVAQVNQEIDRLRRELQTERETSGKLEKERQKVIEEKTALTVQLSDLRTQVENFEKVNSEKQQMQASLADLRHALSEQQREQQVERNRMKAQMTEMEDLVQHLRDVAERRRSLENDREEMRRQLQSKEEQISALNLNKTELCRVHEETVESLRASLREMERRCELQTLQHEEAMLELEAMRKKQHYRQQQEEQQQQLRQQQQELEEEQAQRKKEEEEEEEKRTKEAEEVEKRTKELEAQEANFVENLVASLKSGKTMTDGAKVTPGLLNGSLGRRRTPSASENDTMVPHGQTSSTPTLRIFTAKYSYDPYHYSPNENPDAELSLKSGEYLIVHGTMDADGFFMGEHMDGRRGLVPSNFVEPVDMSELGPDFNLSAILGRPDGASNGSDDEKSLPTAPSSLSHEGAPKGGRSSTPASPPAPCLLKIERTLSNSLVVAWQPPHGPLSAPISAYHVYVDGQFRTAVQAASKTRALLEGVDMRRMHRVSVRTVTSSGQSKDAECTLMVGDNSSPSPDQLKATQITTTGAKLSWLPGDSKCSHTVMVNGREVKTLPPGDYKLHLNRLTPDTLHRVRVVAKPNSASNHCGVANQLDTFAASVEFRTLPGGLIEAPIDVQVEEGPQDSTMLISWLPVTLEEGGESNGVKVEGYVIAVNGQRVREVSGATSDHHLLPIDSILPVIGDNLNSLLQLTVRTRGTDGSESSDSHPPAEISALSLGRGRTSLKVLRRSAEPRSSPSVRQIVQVGKSPTEEFNSLESPPVPTKGVAVPEIHIIGSDMGHAPEHNVGYGGITEAPPRILGHAEAPRVHDRRSHRRKQPPRRPDDEEAADRELEAVMSLSRQNRPPLQAGTSPTENLEQLQSPEWSRTPPTHQQAMQAIKNTRLFVALYDYDPSTMSPNQDAVDEELPFREGQLIRVYGDHDEDGFYFAETNGRRGLVPYNMISEVTDPGPDDPENDPSVMRLDGPGYQRSAQGSSSVDPASMNRGRMRRMVALYDYDPHELSPNVDADDMELAFHTGDVIFVFGDMDDDGFFLGESLASGRQGLVPSNFLQELPSRSPSPLPHGNPSTSVSRPIHPSDSSVPHREGRRSKGTSRVGSSGPSVTAPSASPGSLNAANYGNVISTDPKHDKKGTSSVSSKPATSTTDEISVSSLTRARPFKAIANPTTNSLPPLSNGSASSSEPDLRIDTKNSRERYQKRTDAGRANKRSSDSSVYNNIDLSSLQNPYLKQSKRTLSSDDSSKFIFSTLPKQNTSSVSSSVSSRDVTPLSTPTPSKKNSPRPSTSSQPGTPHAERKRSSVFKNPFKKRRS